MCHHIMHILCTTLHSYNSWHLVWMWYRFSMKWKRHLKTSLFKNELNYHSMEFTDGKWMPKKNHYANKWLLHRITTKNARINWKAESSEFRAKNWSGFCYWFAVFVWFKRSVLLSLFLLLRSWLCSSLNSTMGFNDIDVTIRILYRVVVVTAIHFIFQCLSQQSTNEIDIFQVENCNGLFTKRFEFVQSYLCPTSKIVCLKFSQFIRYSVQFNFLFIHFSISFINRCWKISFLKIKSPIAFDYLPKYFRFSLCLNAVHMNGFNMFNIHVLLDFSFLSNKIWNIFKKFVYVRHKL